jgi:hypothetical protein
MLFGNTYTPQMKRSQHKQPPFLTLQIAFYVCYLMTTFTIDVAGMERFSVWQVFSSLEFSFFGRRGLLTCLSLVLAMTVAGFAFASIVRDSRKVR